jgi:predicted nucleic acid-binding protein
VNPVYLDASIVIYSVEGQPTLQARAQARLVSLQATGGRFAVSPLTQLECYVMPIRQQDVVLQKDYDRFFADPSLVHVDVTHAAFRRATLIRAHHRLRLADALHLATAVEAGCDRFLTADVQLQSFPDIPVEVLA